LAPLFFGEGNEALVVLDDRSLVGGDGVGTSFKRGDEMVDGWLAGLRVERANLE